MNRYLLLALMGFFILQCDVPFNDVGPAYVLGQLFVSKDVFDSDNQVPLADDSVTINYATVTGDDTLNYLFTAVTDDEGFFKFTTLREDERYTLRYDRIIDSIRYFGSVEAEAGDDAVRLEARIAENLQTGLKLTAEYGGGRLAGVNHCLFLSEELADKAKRGCSGSSQQLISDAYGQSSSFSIKAGNYWVNSRLKNDQVDLFKRSFFSVENGKVTTQEIEMEAVDTNRLQLLITDENDRPLAGVYVCAFDNEHLFNRTASCTGSNHQAATSSRGIATFDSLTPGTYYFRATLETEQGKWTGTLSKAYTGREVSDTLKLEPTNGMSLLTVDANGGRLPKVQVCLFNSGILFARSTCEGNTRSLHSNMDGEVNFFDLRPDTFFVFSYLEIDTIRLESKDTFVLSSTEIIRDTLFLE